MIFTHSGHLGDCLYSLPAVKILSGGNAIMYIKRVFEDHRGHINGNTGPEGANYTQYDAIKDLLLQQPYIREVREYVPPEGYDYSPGLWPGLKPYIDLDDARKQDRYVKRYVFHVERYFRQFNIQQDWRECIPWLQIDHEKKRADNYAIFHITDRWHGFLPDWKKIYQQELRKYDKIYFTGYKHDYDKFESRYSTLMDYLPTGTLLDLTRTIRDARAVYCNQNCALVIAQGLGKEYYLARNIDRTHCHTALKNEHII